MARLLLPQVTGTYTFSLDKADDIGLAWLGPNAVSGFTVANSLLSGYAYSSDRPYPLNTTTVDAVAGVPVPFRLMWANAELQGAFEFTVTDPNSVVVLGAPVHAQSDLCAVVQQRRSGPPLGSLASE